MTIPRNDGLQLKGLIMNSVLISTLKNIFLLFAIFTIVFLVNQPIISFNMLYQEQTTIYLANQTIHSWHDLLNIYLHPTWLNINIPFFRPSGHFLIYQLLMPFFGWHNLLALNIISFSFLALTGFFIIKLYQLLFPEYKSGAFIAFAIYLMHPSLSISRITFMHFDFAYVCFLVLSLYLFVLFCQKKNIAYFIFSLIFYVVSVTFKEPAIMLGPVLFLYYWLTQPHEKKFSILLIITATSALLSLYLFQSWPSMQYAGNTFNLSHTLGTANVLIKDIFGISSNLIPYGTLKYEQFAWRTTVFTPSASLLMWILFSLSIITAWLMHKEKTAKIAQKSFYFLFLSALLFMVLPLAWASGAPWHHSLSLICLSMMMGFSVEYFLKRFSFTEKYSTSCSLIIAVLIAWIGVIIHFENTIKYYLLPQGFLGISLNRNAVLSPPDIKDKLNDESILVVEDSELHVDYFLGNSAYPFLLFFTNADYDKFELKQKQFYQQFHHTYSGNLFRYAYLKPHLKEELYPFQIEYMDDIPNEIIYNWLKHANNIFCIGYDPSANWLDKTKAFKTALMKQQDKRKLEIRTYQTTSITSLPEKIAYTKQLPFPDQQLCEYTCDQDKQCKGFMFKQVLTNNHYETTCYFNHQMKLGKDNCNNCTINTKA